MMKFLLVVPRFIERVGYYYEFPLGLAYISASLKAAGHEVRCLNLNHAEAWPSDAVAQAVGEFDPDVCGTGTLSPHFPQAKLVLDAARQAKPSIVNVVGGGVFSGDPELMSRVLDVDFGVIGEGEQAIVDLAEALEKGTDPAAVSGIAFRGKDGEFVQTAPRPAIRDLDSVPWPDYDGFDIETYMSTQRRVDNYFFHTEEQPRSLPMIASRSCPFNCTFCFHPSGRVYRKRGLDALFAEIDFLVGKYRPKMISFLDELFAIKKTDLLDFCARIKPYGLSWMVSLHVTSVDQEVIAAMRDAGCTYISYGIENISEPVLRSMNKKATPAQIEQALDLTYRNKIGIQGNFIFGDPAETYDTANETLDWWARHRQYQINLTQLQIYPGSPVHAKAIKDGIIRDREQQLREPHLNVTTFTEDGSGRLGMKLAAFGEALLLPAKIISFEKQPGVDPVRGEAHRAVVECPHCGHVNHLTNLLFDRNTSFQALRLTCLSCRGRFDVQNLARRPWRDARCETLYTQASALRSQDRLREAMQKYSELLCTEYPLRIVNRPDAYIRAAYDVGTLFLQSGKDPQMAVYHLARAVYLDAFNPQYHLTFAQALMAEGSLGAARLHFEQVLRLVKADGGTSALLDTVRKIIAALPDTDYRDAYVRAPVHAASTMATASAP
jgi:radical SAM superfamily enzyme YgiQ (UPF0313 family)